MGRLKDLTVVVDPACTACKLHRNADEVCTPGWGNTAGDVMVVSKMPNSDRYTRLLIEDLADAGIEVSRIYWASALKCRNFEDNTSNLDVKTCRTYLEQEIALMRPRWILALGNEALLATTGKSGITKYRGKPFPVGDHTVMATISPAAVLARPQNRPGYKSDLKLFANKVKGIESKIVPIDFTTIDTMSKLKEVAKDLAAADTLSFDIESTINPLGEFDPNARMISIAGTYVIDGQVRGFALPLWHPGSVWRSKWRAIMRFLSPYFMKPRKRIAHNGKFDSRWMRQFGVEGMFNTFDTMLAVHLLDENAQKALKVQAPMRLGVEPWGVDTKSLLDMPIEEVLEYNFLDTYYTYLIYLQLKEELKEQPRLLRLFLKLMMPSNTNLIPAEQRGVYLDLQRLKDRKPQAEAKLASIEGQIMSYLPPRDDPRWPVDARGKALDPNFNRSNFALWMLFQYLNLPVIARGKEKQDGSLGDPSMAEPVMLELREDPDHHPIIDLMLDRVGWQKNLSGFFNAYERLHDANSRVHTSFKLYGTVTGRLSSGKDDVSKMSGRTGGIRGVNLQQVPRDPFIRGLFGATPGYTWIEADFSQVELRIAAFIARERHMIELYRRGEDIHMATAMRMTGKPARLVTKEERKKAKPVNFGFLYGMGWRKFIITAFNNYGIKFSEAEARAAREAYFEMYPDLPAWHERQRRLVRTNGRVQSPIGRIRHLPDIYSPDEGVQAEAERQAINSPVQGLASDMALAGMNLFVERLEEQGLSDRVHVLGLVHDAINVEAKDDVAGDAMVLLKESMQDMDNMRRKFGLIMTVPIVADVKVGRHWGDSVELKEEMVYDYPGTDRVLEMAGH